VRKFVHVAGVPDTVSTDTVQNSRWQKLINQNETIDVECPGDRGRPCAFTVQVSRV
jgi:hypothetical protein